MSISETTDAIKVTEGGVQDLEVRLLGQFDVRLNGLRVNIPTNPARFLFAYLLLKQPHPQNREKLAALFWPDASDTNSRTSFRQAKWRINKAFEAAQLAEVDIITGDELFVTVNPDANIWLDTVVLISTAESIEELIYAVSVYEGTLLPGCYDDWAVVEREFYEVLFAQKMQKLLDLLVGEKRWSEVIPWAERWIKLGEVPEPAYRALMYAHAGLGDISQVAIVYRRCKDALWRELGVEPSEHTTKLFDQLVKGESSLARGYELLEHTGSSASGELYRALQPALNREVALKVITPRLANSPDFIRSFETEAQLIARLDHIHIRPLYDYWRDPGGAYLVMRWLNGGNLTGKLQQGPLLLDDFARLLDQTASGLAAAHQRGIVHGHLKPDNILFDQEGNAYLSDFAIALDDGSIFEKRKNNQQIRTYYIAPEQTVGEPASELSDQYTLAAILYEALTGHNLTDENNEFFHSPEELPFTSVWDADQQNRVGDVFEQALSSKPSKRFADVMTFANALKEALLPEIYGSNSKDFRPVPALEATNPYKGLRAFREADSTDFYGREALVERMVARLDERSVAARFLALVGPSGSGKSSVIHAGLVPALSRGMLPGSENWYVVALSPGAHPLKDLAVDLLHIAAREPENLDDLLSQNEFGLTNAVLEVLPDPASELLLVIDQFEELFTLVESKNEVDHFLNLLSSAVMQPDSAVRVVIALRADFYDRPLIHPAFGDLMRQRTEVVIPMNADELWQAVVAPVAGVGVTLEPGLETTIVSEVMERPSALPLFQYALTELFELREGRLLTRKAYESIGGVPRALARRAEVVYGSLTLPERAVAKQVFLRLVNPEGGGDTLRRVALSELNSLTAATTVVDEDDLYFMLGWGLDGAGIPTDKPDKFDEIEIDAGTISIVLEDFGRSRLLTFDHDPITREPTVEVAHDALLREWNRLQIWLADSRSDLHMQRLLANAAHEWFHAGKDASYLLLGTRLDQLQTWAKATTLVLNEEEQAFLEASLAARQQRQNELIAAQQLEEKRLRQRRRRDRTLAGVVVLSLLLIVTAGALSLIAYNQARTAFSRQLAAQCLSSRYSQFDLALLLCLEADRFADTFEARSALATLYSENPQQKYTLRGQQSSISNIAFCQDSDLLASSGADGSILLWDAASGQPFTTAGPGFLESGNGASAPTSNSGEALILACAAGYNISASSAAEGKITLHRAGLKESYELPDFTERATSLAISPDGRILAAGTPDGRILLWDILLHRLTGSELKAHNGPVESLAFNQDGSALASGGVDNSVIVWDVASGISQNVVEQDSPILAIEYSPDGRYLASSSAEGSIILSDLNSDPLTSKLLAFGIRADALAFNPISAQLAAGFIDGTISLWDVSTGLPIAQGVIGHRGAIKDLAYSPDGQTLASGSDDRNIILRYTASNQSAHSEAITGVSYRPDGLELATSSRDGTVRYWLPDLHSASIPPFKEQSEGVNEVVFSPDGKLAASAGRDGTIALIDVASGQQIRSLSDHEALVTSLAFSPDGRKLASGSADNKIIVWDLASRKLDHQILEGHEDWVFSVAFSPDGKLLASGGRDNRVILWDLKTGTPSGEPIDEHEGWVYSVAFSPDGRWLASGGADNLIYLWNLSKRLDPGIALVGHEGYVFDISFSDDSSQIFTAGASGAVRSWDVKTGQPIGQPLTAHQGAVYSLDLSPDGKWLATGGQDAAVRLWRADLKEWACEAVGRNLTRQEWANALQVEKVKNNLLIGLLYHRTCPQWSIES